MSNRTPWRTVGWAIALSTVSAPAMAQLIDRNLAPNTLNAGIAKTLEGQIGAGRGDVNTPGSSAYIIARDPFRAIRRGRQMFQRKFTHTQGQGPLTGDGSGNIAGDLSIGAGLSDSCAGCHGRPRGSAGFGGDVVTRPDSRDAPHLFGLGLKEMLGDEITNELRRIRAAAINEARHTRRNVTKLLFVRQGITYGSITARPNGTVDTSQVKGVDADLRVRPFFLQGGTISMREFLIGAFNAEMGLEAVDPQMNAAVAGARYVTPSGMVLDGRLDKIELPPTTNSGSDTDRDGIRNEIPTSLVDFMEFYLLNYFKAGQGEVTSAANAGRNRLQQLGCTSCHIPDLIIARDRRVADLDTVYDPARGNFNRLFATAAPLFQEVNDGSGFPALRKPLLGAFTVRNIYTDFKRHDLGPNFHENNYDGTQQREFLTTALWGSGSTAPYGHDGRSINLTEVILRHGGEAQAARDQYAALSQAGKDEIAAFVNTLVLFPPDDTASTLDPGNRATVGFPQFGHGSIRLTGLFLDPTDIE